jgi:hypothetical protein
MKKKSTKFKKTWAHEHFLFSKLSIKEKQDESGYSQGGRGHGEGRGRDRLEKGGWGR